MWYFWAAHRRVESRKKADNEASAQPQLQHIFSLLEEDKKDILFSFNWLIIIWRGGDLFETGSPRSRGWKFLGRSWTRGWGFLGIGQFSWTSYVYRPLSEVTRLTSISRVCWSFHCVKSAQIWSFFWSVFSCIQTEYRKIRTRKNSVFGYFSRSVYAGISFCYNNLKSIRVNNHFVLFKPIGIYLTFPF